MSRTDITRSEVSEHNSNNSAWMVIGNRHPGGCEVLLEKAGQDGTESFEDIGHSTDAREMRDQYCIGQITEDEKWEYSYDKRHKTENSTDKSLDSKSTSTETTLVYAGMVAVIALIVYYLLLS